MTWDITLPASSQTEIQNILNGMGPNSTLIEIQNDIVLTSELDIHNGRTVGFTSESGNKFFLSGDNQHRIIRIITDAVNVTTVYIGNIILKDGMTPQDGGAIYSTSPGTAHLIIDEGAVFDGNHAMNGGAISIEKGCVTMEGGTILSNHATGSGGGIHLGVTGMAPCDQAVFIMSGGEIARNTAVLGGGGIYEGNAGELVKISGGRFFENNCADSGGGMYVTNLEMTGGEVNENVADNAGGGIYLAGTGIINGLSDNRPITIYRNRAVVKGGGIALADEQASTLSIGGRVEMMYNVTDGIGGGAIWIEHSKLADLTVGPSVIFRGNRAPTGYALRFPADDAVYYANIHATVWTSPYMQGYNNFDISYIGRNPEPEPGCTATGEQMADVCLPVEVKPFANVGTISTRCCGPARITSGTDTCEGTPDGNCNFTISQRICVEVPVEFGAEVTPGEVHVGCTGNDCTNCQVQGEE